MTIYDKDDLKAVLDDDQVHLYLFNKFYVTITAEEFIKIAEVLQDQV